jgi:transposase
MPIAPTILAELGDARRFGNGDAVVRHTGLDVTVPSSDHKPRPGHCPAKDRRCWAGRCSRPPTASARPTSPDHDLYTQLKTRVDGNRAALTVARRLTRRVRHT